MKHILYVVAFLIAQMAFTLRADDLNLGDPAPKLAPSKWIKGEEVKGFEKGNVYVIEFWATWCKPCMKSIPHMTEVQKKYKDKNLIVIGQNVMETNTEDVPDFVIEMGDKMGYRVALDEKDAMNKEWMDGAGREGLPTAFIVDKNGIIAWIGYPLDTKFDVALDQIIAGKYDLQQAIVKAKNAWLPELKLADAAPGLVPGKWIKGQPIKELEKGKIYVVDFWATWCGLCKTSIPHLTDIQKKYADKNVIVIGQSIGESKPEDVTPYVKEMGDKMGYRVAVDDMEGSEIGKMADTWMLAAKQESLPATFIINSEGLVAYIGNPNEKEFDKVLEEIIAGKQDLKKAASVQRLEFEKDRDAKKIDKIVRPIVAEEKWDELMAKIDEMVKIYPHLKPELIALKLTTLIRTGGKEAIGKTSDELIAAVGDDSNALMGIAARLANPQLKNRDLELAIKYALRADELAKSNNADYTDLLASLYFEKGDRDKAIEKESAAILQADSAEQKDYYKEKLKFFQDKSNK